MGTTVGDLRISSDDLVATSYPILEPINAPAFFGNRLDRFGNIYNLSNNSHLFRFLASLCGDSGAGQLKKDMLLPRLEQQLDATHFANIDRLYGNPLGLPRLSEEIYNYHPETDFLNSAQWDEVLAKDASYRARCLIWMRALIAGPTPRGMALAGEAAIGVECDVWERYQYVQFPGGDISQDYSRTNGLNEFVLIPRLPGEALTQANIRAIKRLTDQLKPTNSVCTVWMDGGTHGNVARLKLLPLDSAATSEWHNVQRLVTGRADVVWPDIDISKGLWIDTAEREAPTMAFMNSAESVTYLTITSATASSFHVGFYNQSQRALFSHLESANEVYPPTEAYDTGIAPLSINTGWNGGGITGNNIVVNRSYPIGYLATVDSATAAHPVANTFWSSLEQPPPEPEWIVFELGRIRPVNYIYFEICQKPIDWTIEWQDSNGDWSDIPLREDYPASMSMGYLPSNSNPWAEFNIYFKTVQASAIRINFTRREDPFPLITSDPMDFSIELRDVHIMHTIPTADDFIEDVGVDVLGNQFRTAIQTYSASNTLDGSATPWYSQPNPSKFAVEALYFKLDEEIIDEIYINPITYGPDMHFYYSDEDNTSELYSAIILNDRPKAYWRLEEGSGNFVDSTGNLHTGVATGGITYLVSGGVNNGISLDGSSGYFTVTDHADLDLGDVFTLECWLRPLSLSFPASIIDKGTGAYQLTLLTDNTFRLQARDGTLGCISTVAIPNDGHYHHIVATKNGPSEVRLYLDGEDVSGPLIAATALVNTSTDLRVGATAGSPFNYYKGGIDEIALYSTPLNVSQVKAHFEAAEINWDDKLWTPIPRNYIMKKGYHALPHPINPRYFKIEFSNLTPIPYEPVQFPQMPPVVFRRYPIWINNFFNSLTPHTVVKDALVQNDPLTIDPLKFGFEQVGDKLISSFEAERIKQTTDPQPEIKEFIDKIVNKTDTISQSQTDIEHTIEYHSVMQWQTDLIANLDSGRALSRVALEPHLNTATDTGWNSEMGLPSVTPPVFASTEDQSIVLREKLFPVMFFSRRCRHQYQIVKAPIDRKIAYIAGVNEVGFYRRDTVWRQDDRLYIETLDDTEFAEINDFIQSDWRWTVD